MYIHIHIHIHLERVPLKLKLWNENEDFPFFLLIHVKVKHIFINPSWEFHPLVPPGPASRFPPSCGLKSSLPEPTYSVLSLRERRHNKLFCFWFSASCLRTARLHYEGLSVFKEVVFSLSQLLWGWGWDEPGGLRGDHMHLLGSIRLCWNII